MPSSVLALTNLGRFRDLAGFDIRKGVAVPDDKATNGLFAGLQRALNRLRPALAPTQPNMAWPVLGIDGRIGANTLTAAIAAIMAAEDGFAGPVGTFGTPARPPSVEALAVSARQFAEFFAAMGGFALDTRPVNVGGGSSPTPGNGGGGGQNASPPIDPDGMSTKAKVAIALGLAVAGGALYYMHTQGEF